MIKSKFYKQNGVEFQGLSDVLCKKKDLEGKILQGLFSEKYYAILAKRGLHRNTTFIPTLALVLDFSLKNTLFNMVLFVKIPVIRVIRPVRKAFVAKM